MGSSRGVGVLSAGMVEVGFCSCGCGERTALARQTRRAEGAVLGQPLRFVQGHQNRGRRWSKDPNPSGLCMCGCGGGVPWARGRRVGHVRFLPGHACRRSPVDYVVDGAGCWVWQRKVTRYGYGILEVGPGQAMAAHRWVWVRERGELEDSVDLHHECGVKLCVNPGHLVPLSREEHRRLHAAG